MKNRATVVYILMIVLCGAGLWVILRVGAKLHAPADLSGVWDMEPADPGAAGALGKTMTIDQSGRYAEVQFESGRVLAMKLADAQPTPPAASLVGQGWTLDASVSHGPDGRTMAANLRGPEAHAFTARLRNGRQPGSTHASH